MPTTGAKDTLNALHEILARLDQLKGGAGAVTPPAIPPHDPTPNVLALVEAAMQRQDDLRKAANAETIEIRRIKEDCAKETSELRDRLGKAESARIDAIRAVDVAAVALANERGIQQASVLANQVSTSAEALRVLVATTADQIAKTLAATVNQLTDRLSLLEKSQYQIGGRDIQKVEERGQSNVVRSLAVTLALFIVGWIITIIVMLVKS